MAAEREWQREREKIKWKGEDRMNHICINMHMCINVSLDTIENKKYINIIKKKTTICICKGFKDGNREYVCVWCAKVRKCV